MDTQFPPVQFGLNRVQPNQTEKEALALIRKTYGEIKKLTNEYYQSKWDFMCQGEEYEKPLQEVTVKYMDYFNNNQEGFLKVKKLMGKKKKLMNRPLVLRQVENLYKALKNAGKSQELKDLEKKIELRGQELTKIYNSYRPMVDGEQFSNMQVTQRVETTTDKTEAKKLFMARMGYAAMETQPGGPTLPEALKDLVKQRNEMAKQNKNKQEKPYTDFYQMHLAENDIDEARLVRLLKKMEITTRKPYAESKKVLNKVIQKRYNISEEEARLPYYDNPGNLKKLLSFDLQPYLNGKDPKDLMIKTADLMGENIRDNIQKSNWTTPDGKVHDSLYLLPENKGKSQHWFMFPIDAPKDVRIFGSIDPNLNMMSDYADHAMLHEGSGHARHYSNINPRLPYGLRSHNSIITEAYAMLHEALQTDAERLEKVVGLSKEEAREVSQKAIAYKRAEKIRQIRWMIGLILFEREMYKNPDQDFNKLWWDMMEKMLGQKRPEEGEIAEYARIPHFLSHPGYMPNYFLADAARAQILAEIEKDGGKLLSKEAGEYLRTYAAVGKSYPWEDIIERMTGKPLGVEALANEFKGLKLPEPA